MLFRSEAFSARVQYQPDGVTRLNPVLLDGLQGSNPKEVGLKLNEIADNARTHGAHEKIGTLYGFDLLVKSETTVKDGFDLIQNRFFIKGAGDILYNYNHGIIASDPKTASLNFLNALDSMPKLRDRYQAENEKLQKDIPVLKEVVEGSWRKEPELKALKEELVRLDRKIQLSLKPIEEGEGEEMVANDQENNLPRMSETAMNNDILPPNVYQEKRKMATENLITATFSNNPLEMEKKNIIKGIKI